MDQESLKAFHDDALELLDELERNLLSLEDTPEGSTIEAIFRALHTLKGSSYMFGYDALGDFFHEMEEGFDQVRKGKRQADQDLTQPALQATDHTRSLLADPSLLLTSLYQPHQKLLEHFRGLNRGSSTHDGPTDPAHNQQEAQHGCLMRVWPKTAIGAESEHPLRFILEDLATKGASALLPETNDEGNLRLWQLLLVSPLTTDELEAQFIFYDEEALVEVLDLGFDQAATTNETLLEHLRQNPEAIAENLKQWMAENLANQAPETTQEAGPPSSASQAPKAGEQQRRESMRVSADKIDELFNNVSELITLHASAQNLAERDGSAELNAFAEQMERITDDLRDAVFSISLVPVEQLMGKSRRLIRDVARELGKEARLETAGTDTELDKTVIEALSDPLMHLLRNAIDHGLEPPQERQQLGKPQEGTVWLEAYYSGANVFIEIRDDGRGLDAQKIRQKAEQNGLLEPDTPLSEEETFQMIFEPGFSTAEQVTDLSGRGVGMDVVKRQIMDIRGQVDLRSAPGQGTTILIRLPLTVSIMEGMLVRVAGSYYVLPLNAVERIDALSTQQLAREDRFSALVEIEGEQKSVIDLYAVFEHEGQRSTDSRVVTMSNGRQEKGFVVDQVEGQMQAVIKPLGPFYAHQDFLSGGTILGNGTLALVLDTDRLMEQSTKTARRA